MFDANEAKRLSADLAKADEMASPAPWEPNVWIETDGNEWRATGPGHEEHASDHGSEPGCPDEQAAQRDAQAIATLRNLALSASQQLAGACEEVERLTSDRDDFERRWITAFANGCDTEADRDRLAARVAELEADNKWLRDEKWRTEGANVELRSQLASVKRARDEACDLAERADLDSTYARIAELRRVGGSDE